MDRARSIPLAPVLSPEPLPTAAWRRFLFRFGVLFLALVLSVRLIGLIPWTGWLNRQVYAAWRAIVPWVGREILHLDKPVPLAASGSGDKLFDWLQVGTMLALALLGAAVWVWFDRRRRADALLGELTRIGLRYFLGAIMLSYGMSKILRQQMPEPGFHRWLQPYGESSPMGLVWTFMGHSWAYSAIAGGLEFLGGFLLFFRRTTALGALILVPVLANVLFLNLCFDIPVKLYSGLYLAFAIVLAAPSLRALVDVLWFHRTTTPPTPLRSWPTGRPARLLFVAKLSMILWLLWLIPTQSVWRWAERPVPAKSDLVGLYEVETFSRNGRELPPLLTDAQRWRRLAIDERNLLTVFYMNDTRRAFQLRAGPGFGKLTLQPFTAPSRPGGNRPPPAASITLDYTRTSPDRFLLAGKLDGADLSVTLRRADERKLLLPTRGFHWISEQPFNR